MIKMLYQIRRKRRSLLEEREQQRAHERLVQGRAEENQERAEKQETEDLVIAVLISEDLRRFIEELSRDLADARRAVLMAHERSLAAVKQAAAALARIQSQALMLFDGRRVYFSADGSVLYTEDRRRVTDTATLREAHELSKQHPFASRYEQFDAAETILCQAQADEHTLAATLERLDELSERIHGGEQTPEELAAARIELDELIAALPNEARDYYEEFRAGREGAARAYQAADDVFDAAPALKSHFDRADSQFGSDLESNADSPAENAAPVTDLPPRSKR